jgi:FAD/FMN-containing dehydrogenase
MITGQPFVATVQTPADIDVSDRPIAGGAAYDAFLADLDGVPLITKPAQIRQKSRDFFWYSPILKEKLADYVADLVAAPTTEAQIIQTIKACVAKQVPLTVRGAGTGNYGQIIPLKGGVIMDLSEFNRVLWTKPGAVRTQAGIKIAALDKHTRRVVGMEQRLHPSTARTATIGGFIAGGSSGIGAIGYGLLRDRGNILGLKILTMEAEPRVLELRGDDIQKCNHAYGTNGIIVEVEMPMAPAYTWVDAVLAFDDFMTACRFCQALGEAPGIVKKEIAPIAAPVGKQYFRKFQRDIDDSTHLVMVMIAEHSIEAYERLQADFGGCELYRQTDAEDAGTAPVFEFTWNHTTLHALAADKTITYLQTLFPPPNHLALVEQMYQCFGDEVPMHLEFVRLGGQVACFGLQLVRYSTPERVIEIIKRHEDAGCPIFNPHAFTLEEGGMKTIDNAQLDFKREADPHGLLNPGKMIAWDKPDYDPNTYQGKLYPAAGAFERAS